MVSNRPSGLQLDHPMYMMMVMCMCTHTNDRGRIESRNHLRRLYAKESECQIAAGRARRKLICCRQRINGPANR